MHNRHFFSTRLGWAAMLAISAMVAFNIVALSQQMQAEPQRAPLAASALMVELA